MNFLRQGFRKLSSDRHSCRQTRLKLKYHAASRVVNNGMQTILPETKPTDKPAVLYFRCAFSFVSDILVVSTSGIVCLKDSLLN